MTYPARSLSQERYDGFPVYAFYQSDPGRQTSQKFWLRMRWRQPLETFLLVGMFTTFMGAQLFIG